MTEPTRPPAAIYEITWNSGHIERVAAHQVAWPNNGLRLFRDVDAPNRIELHAYIGDRWTLQLSALMDDIRTIRNVTADEVVTQ